MPIKLCATVLNLIAPGAGLALLGHTRQAWLSFLLLLLVLGGATLWRWVLHPGGWFGIAAAAALVAVTPMIWAWQVGTPAATGGRNLRHAAGLCAAGLIVLSSVLCLRSQVLGLQLYFIPSPSMTPTLQPGDFILVDSWAYREHPPTAGDIVVFEHDGLNVIKRSATWPGSTSALRNGLLYVLGDNPQDSFDSRRLGGIDLHRVSGRAVYRLAHWNPDSGQTVWPLQPLGPR